MEWDACDFGPLLEVRNSTSIEKEKAYAFSTAIAYVTVTLAMLAM